MSLATQSSISCAPNRVDVLANPVSAGLFSMWVEVAPLPNRDWTHELPLGAVMDVKPDESDAIFKPGF